MPTLVGAGLTGPLLYVRQPLLYPASGALQAQVGTTTALLATVSLLVPAAIVAARGPAPSGERRPHPGARRAIPALIR